MCADFSNAGYDKDELKQLGVSLQGGWTRPLCLCVRACSVGSPHGYRLAHRHHPAPPTGWAAAIGKVGLEFGDEDLLWAKVAELIEAAPDASDDDSD